MIFSKTSIGTVPITGKNLSKLLKIIMSGFHFITSSIVTFDQ